VAHLAIASAASSLISEISQWSPADGNHYTNPDAGPNGEIAYQRNTDSGGTLTGTPEVWVANTDTGSTRQLVTDASQPAVFGGVLAFVRSDGTHQQIFSCQYTDGECGAATQLTTGAVDHTNPTFESNGATIAFNLAGGTIGKVAVAGGTTSTVSGITGVPAFQSLQRENLYRLSGANRFGTPVNVSKSHWDAGAADAVVLSRSDNYADALSGSALAAAKHGPLLLTPPDSLNTLTSAEISRVLGTVKPDATVYLLGGTGAISATVESAVQALGYQTVRLSGANRYATSLAIANEITTDPVLVLAATGVNFPDALAAGAAAGAWTTAGTPTVVVLTQDTTLPAVTKSYLDGKPNAGIVSIGGQAVTATAGYSNVIAAVAGSTRYETASIVAEVFFDGTTYAGVATGTDWPDALAGGALLGTLNGPLLLTNGTKTALDLNAEWVLSDRSAAISKALVFGGTGAVSDSLATTAASWIAPSFTTESNPTGLEAAITAATASVQSLAAGKAKVTKSLKQRLGTPVAPTRH
jgi:putative cell wall-binding protein